MSYGRGYEPRNGWHPPSDPEPTRYGRRRSPDDDQHDQPRLAAEPEDSWPPLTDRYGPRPPSYGGFAPGGSPAPVEPMERARWPERDSTPVPPRWADPEFDLPDRRRRPGESSS